MQELADWNARFERKFGHIFIICAAGKSAGEVLQALKSR
jgi:2-oxo-4-hydroxy-4-carboxy--5-ureidoimidazoline (OHCU) decarboxylase